MPTRHHRDFLHLPPANDVSRDPWQTPMELSPDLMRPSPRFVEDCFISMFDSPQSLAFSPCDLAVGALLGVAAAGDIREET